MKKKARERSLQGVTSKAKCVLEFKGKTKSQTLETDAKGPE